MRERLLVLGCHEAWTYQLRWLDYDLDIIVGLNGRRKAGWDEAIRPAPPSSRLLTLPEALATSTPYHCIVAHSISDLLEVRKLSGPRLLVLHSTLEGLILERDSNVPAKEMRRGIEKYLSLVGGHAAAVSSLKGRSWGLSGDIVPSSVNPADYLPFQGEVAAGLRVSNPNRRAAWGFSWHFHRQAFASLPVTLVGNNPGLPDITAARDWDHLKELLRSHRFYIHTADPRLEDGYDLATLEAMAAGLPVLGNRHPSSPIEHGVSGFLSDDPSELRRHAQRLLDDRELAVRMGRAAQQTVAERFSAEQFRAGLQQSINTARHQWQERFLETHVVA
jgi:hypothetical protein